MTSFRRKVLADSVSEVKLRSSGLGWALSPGTGIFIRRSCEHTEETSTEGRWPGEEGVRNWSEVALSQGRPRISGNP